MAVQGNIPQIAALKKAVEARMGMEMQTHNDFLALVDAIENDLKEHMSDSTLQRLWGYSTRVCSSVSIRTLNVLSRFAGHDDWKEFCGSLLKMLPYESEEFMEKSIIVDSLEPGTTIRLAWYPDRIVTVRFLGGFRFEVIASENSSLKPGDSFSCFQIQVGRELYLDKFSRKGSEDQTRYVVGQRNGITSATIL